MLGNVSLEDALGAPFFTLGTAVSSGIATVSVFGTALSSHFMNIGTSGGISWAFLLSIIPLVVAFVTSSIDTGDVVSKPSESGLENEEWAAFILGLATVFGLEFVSELQNAVMNNEILSVGVLGLASAAYYIVAYRYGDTDTDDD